MVEPIFPTPVETAIGNGNGNGLGLDVFRLPRERSHPASRI